MTAASPPVWAARVVCGHRAVLGRPPTIASWAADDGCVAADLGGWQVGVDAATPAEVSAVLAAVASAREAGTASVEAPDPALAASVLVRAAARDTLPPCSILLADGDQLAALAWGRPLGIVELGGWEYAVTSAPPAGPEAWTALAAGTVAALDPCGPTIFPLRAPDAADTEEPR